MSTVRLYEQDETLFNHNGLTIIEPISCIINRNLPEYDYSLEMTVSLANDKWKYLKEERILRVSDDRFDEFFRINLIQLDMNECYIYANHIFFDLNKNFIQDTNIVDKKCNVAIDQLLHKTQYSHNFTGTSDIDIKNSARIVGKNVIDALLSDDENSFINKWGGELDMSQFTFKIDNQIGIDRGYMIIYGKNMESVEVETDMSNVVTRIMPYGFDGITMEDNNLYVDSPYIDNYAMPIIKKIKYENVKWAGSPNFSSSNSIKNFNFSSSISEEKDWWKWGSDSSKIWQSTSNPSYIKITTTTSSVGIAQNIKTENGKNYVVKIDMQVDDGASPSVRIVQGSEEIYYNADYYYNKNNKMFYFVFNSGYDGDSELLIYANTKGTSGTCIRVYSVYMYEYSDGEENEFVYTKLEDAQSKLKELAEREFSEYHIDLPEITYNVNFIELSKTEEYNNLQGLLLVNIGDIITIRHKNLNIDIQARVISYEYNCLTENFNNITLGKYKKGYFTSIVKEANDKLEKLPEVLNNALQDAKENASNIIKSALGGYVVKTESELLIMDTDDINTAQKVWRWNKNGLGYSSTGYNGEYGLAMTSDGQIVADFITAGIMSADRIRTGNIVSADESLNIDLDNNYMAITSSNSSNQTIIDADGMEIQSGNQTLATFREKSYIPTLYADDVICDNLVKQHSFAYNYYVSGWEDGNGSDLNDGLTDNTPMKTIQRVLDELPDVLNHDVTIHVSGQVPGFTVINKLGNGLVTILMNANSCIKGNVLYSGCNGVRILANTYEAHQPTIIGRISIFETRHVEIKDLLIDGDSNNEAIYIERSTRVHIMDCKFKNSKNSYIKAEYSTVFATNNCGDSIPYYIDNSSYAEVYLPSGSTTTVVPVTTTKLVSDAGWYTTNVYNIASPKTPTAVTETTPVYTATSKTQQWNCNNYYTIEDMLWNYTNYGTLRQGRVDGYKTGRNKGVINFNHSGIREIIKNGTNYSGRIYMKRASTSHGLSSGSVIALYASDGTAIDTTTTFSRGEAKWINIPSSVVEKIANGTVTSFYVYWGSSDSSRYIVWDCVCKLEITYTK